VAPGVVATDIRPPLTHLSALPPEVPSDQRSPVELPTEGGAFGPLILSQEPVLKFVRQTIPRDPFLAINQLAFRGASYPPIMPEARYVGLVRPIWLIADVTGMNSGVWYYHPPTDRWSALTPGVFRVEAAYLCAEQPLAGDAAAICVLAANVQQLLLDGGPDSYRLAHLEAGIAAHRMHLAAAAYGLAAVCSARFFDDEFRAFFGIHHSGWEILYTVLLGQPAQDPGVPNPSPPQ
jgi:hypothetical protein